MGVPADKKLRRLSVYFTLYRRTVFTWVTADMRHPNINIFTLKTQVFGKGLADIRAVDITVNTFERFKGLQFFYYLQIAEIAGMPYLVAVFKMFKNRVVEVAVGVGKEAYFGHKNYKSFGSNSVLFV